MDNALKRNMRVFFWKMATTIDNVVPNFGTLKCPPTFLVGPPRSGTTLTRLLIYEGINTSYFSELAAQAVHCGGKPAPLISSLISRYSKKAVTKEDRFVNSYGSSKGKAAPIEGEAIWNYLFGTKYDAVEPEDLSVAQQRKIQKVIHMTELAFGGLPFVDKSTALSVRIRALTKVFPQASFIHVTRDYLDTAQSILVARQTKFPEWIGPRPTECLHSENDTLVQQVCKQVFYTEANIAMEKAVVGEDRFLTIPYSNVCNNPRATFDQIVDFLANRQVPIEVLSPATEPFEQSTGRKVSEDDYAALKNEFEVLRRTE